MARTFDVWFIGANSFGWRGSGSLLVDENGLVFRASKHGLPLPLLRRTNHVEAANLKEVVREGDTLRVDFTDEEKARVTVPLRARDREVAAEIVQLMPTTNTIEMESDADIGGRRGGTLARRRAMLLGIGVLALAAILVAKLWKPLVPAPVKAVIQPVSSTDSLVASAPQAPASATEDRVPAANADVGESPAPQPMLEPPPAIDSEPAKPPVRASTAAAVPEPQDEGEEFTPSIPEIKLRDDAVVVPIARGTVAYDRARSLLRRFEEGARLIETAYQNYRLRVDSGQVTPDALAEKLDGFAQGWRGLAMNLLNSQDVRGAELLGLRGTLVLVADHEQKFYSEYAAGVRAHDPHAIDAASDEKARAEDLLSRAGFYAP